MSFLGEKFELEKFRTLESKESVTLEFQLKNISDEKAYDFVKLFVGQKYIGLKYLEIIPGKSDKAVFKVGYEEIKNNPVIKLTTKDKEDGILLKKNYKKFLDKNESIQEKKMPERLEKEYEDLISEGKNSSIFKKVVKSIKDIDKSSEKEEVSVKTPKNIKEEKESEGLESGEKDLEEGKRTEANRVSTGIENLDSYMQGGFVKGTMNLVTGKTGTGKTSFSASFLKKGAEKGHPGVYVTTEEREEDIKADIKAMFGWEFEKLEENNMVEILSIKPIFPSKEIQNLNRLVRSYISNLLDQVMEAVDKINAERVIIDSVSIIEMFIRDEYMARVALASLLNKLRESEVTAVLTGTVPETSQGLSGGGIIEFLVDTVLLLEFVPVSEDHKRTLTIRKMRRTDHNTNILPMEITKDGVKVYEV